MKQTAPKSFRMHIGLFGRRNVGKSSLLNALTKQSVSIVSEQAGTTTDPVEKPMEMLPLGPVLFIDTAGLDDEGDVGALRIQKSQRVFDRTDLGIIVTDGQWGQYEETILSTLRNKETPVIVAFNKSDLASAPEEMLSMLRKEGVAYAVLSAATGEGVDDFRAALAKNAPDAFIENPTILGDLVPSGELAIFVVPIDKEAPKGRLIMPQVQSIRDLLDSDAMALVVKERELCAALQKLKDKPKLIVTDSQAFLKVAADTPDDIPLTSFSILFARLKGDLVAQTQGARAIDKLKAGDR
ncbi:MAG: [FeFe] hydrogenase H-cluster maturation GTPase HydF, partial [Alphaproteobacteria bacterium]